VLQVEVTGWRVLRLERLVLDVNGTLTRDGAVLPGVEPRLAALRGVLHVSLLSADTFGRLDAIAAQLQVGARRVQPGQPEAPQKGQLVRELGAQSVVAIGNGANDAEMLAAAGLGIAVLGPEGLAAPALLGADLGPEGLAMPALAHADILVASIEDALDLLLNPKRLTATLRR
jgi:soluble P-type ATPase